jgi:hypothetical protein
MRGVNPIPGTFSLYLLMLVIVVLFHLEFSYNKCLDIGRQFLNLGRHGFILTYLVRDYYFSVSNYKKGGKKEWNGEFKYLRDECCVK